MFLKSIRLRGFKGIKSGMGIEELYLDLSTLPGGLIAITGDNGRGKSSLMDNMTPFRLMPFKIRKSPVWSPGAFSFYDQCQGEDALKELYFEMGGIDYRSLVLINAEKRKQEAYLYRRDGEQWVPLCDGKSKEYDRVIEEVCGSPQLFFTSVYRAQGCRNLSDYTRSDIMGIISELLNIDHIREQSDKCRAVVAGLSAGLSLTRDRMVALASEAESADGLVEAMKGIAAGAAGAGEGLLAAKADLQTIQSTLAGYREQQAAQVSEAARLALLNTQLVDERQRLVAGKVKFDQEFAALSKREVDTRAVHERWLVDINTKIARAEKIVTGAESIREAVVREATVQQCLAQDKNLLPTLQAARDSAFRSVSDHKTRLSQAASKLDNCRRDVAKLEGLDCRADASGWLNPTCRFIKDAVASQESLATLEADHGALLEDCSANLALVDADAALADCRSSIANNESSLAEYQKHTRLVPELELAETNLHNWRLEISIQEKKLADDLGILSGEKWLVESGWDLARMASDKCIADLVLQIEAFPVVVDLAGTIRDYAIREGVALAAIAGFETRIRDGELQLASLRTKLEAAQAKGGELVVLQAKEGRLSAEITKFSLLMRACSNSGIISLELDDASPSIAAIVNDLLRACYGSRFSVRLDTQAEKVNGDLKETFDIIIFDAEAGGERSITECSGGQVTVLEDAITRGICLYNIHRSDRVYGTLYSDEKDGALDETRKLEFMRVKREALRVGTHSHEFFITQTQDLVDMADARIVLSPGGVSIQ